MAPTDDYCAVHNHGLDARDSDDRALFYSVGASCTCERGRVCSWTHVSQDDTDREENIIGAVYE